MRPSFWLICEFFFVKKFFFCDEVFFCDRVLALPCTFCFLHHLNATDNIVSIVCNIQALHQLQLLRQKKSLPPKKKFVTKNKVCHYCPLHSSHPQTFCWCGNFNFAVKFQLRGEISVSW